MFLFDWFIFGWHVWRGETGQRYRFKITLTRKGIPEGSGIYIFVRRRFGFFLSPLYIGKATSLRERVRSYFARDLIATRRPLIVDMVFKADRVDFIETPSVLEALILESNLIKKHQPKYNTKEKDNKSYNSVIITDENFPRIFIIRDRELKQIQQSENTINWKNELIKIRNIYGPFPSKIQLENALKIIRKIFPYFDDKKPNQLNTQIGLIPPENISQTEYKRVIRNIELFFEGKKTKIIKQLNIEMKRLSKSQQFEKAEQIKKQIFALNHINDISLISEEKIRPETNFRIESYDIAHMSGKNTVGVMVVMEDGEFNKNEYRKFIIREATAGDDYGALREILQRRFNHDEWQLPKLIIIDGGKAQRNTALKILNEFGYQIPVVSVVKDEYHKPRDIIGDKKFINESATDILKANQETHRFAITFHRQKRNKIN
jgi:excinuclease ABC subunit C